MLNPTYMGSSHCTYSHFAYSQFGSICHISPTHHLIAEYTPEYSEMLRITKNLLCTVVSRKYAPPFAILALVQNAGGAYMRDATISLAITPSLPGMKLLSVAGGGQARGVAEREAEMLTTLAVGSLIPRLRG